MCLESDASREMAISERITEVILSQKGTGDSNDRKEQLHDEQ